MLTLILADSELELVPEEVKTHPAVQAASQRRGKRAGRTLLDSSAHHAAMRQLHDSDRRGRPDIVHTALLVAMDSVLNLEGGLRVLIHTRNDELITLLPETRVMRNFDRFCGLMEQLFREGQAGPPGQPPLLTLQTGAKLAEVVQRIAAERVIALDEGGRTVLLDQELPKLAAAHTNLAFVLGGFPRGGFRSPVKDLAQEVWSIHPQGLSAWVAVAEVLVNWENATRGMPQHRGPPPAPKAD
ncbi:MAG: hypothetical protein LC624_09810 [Halobacteriales archaeon]|nr:hypothetical protein [Halobacteriales archaeon]